MYVFPGIECLYIAVVTAVVNNVWLSWSEGINIHVRTVFLLSWCYGACTMALYRFSCIQEISYLIRHMCCVQLNCFICGVELCTCSVKRNVCSSSRRCVIAVTQSLCQSSVDWCMRVMRVVVTCINVAVKNWTGLLSSLCELQLDHSSLLTAWPIFVFSKHII